MSDVCVYEGSTVPTGNLRFRHRGVPLALAAVMLASMGCNGGSPAGNSGGPAPPASIEGLVFTPDGKQLITAASDAVKIWDVAAGKQSGALPDAGASTCIACSPDGTRLATGGFDKVIYLWDAKTHSRIKDFQGHRVAITAVSFSANGQTLASTASDPNPFNPVVELKLWDIAKGDLLADLEGHAATIRCAVFSPDGKTLASGSEDKSIRLWDVASKAQRQIIAAAHENTIRSLAFSPDGKWLASGSFDNTVKIWDLATLKEKVTLKGHDNRVTSVAFHPDSKQVAAGSDDRLILVWDLSGTQKFKLSGHNGIVNAVAYSPDGQILASCSMDGTVKLWDAAKGEERTTLK